MNYEEQGDRGVGVTFPKNGNPFFDVFEMIESSHTRLLSYHGNLSWVPGTQNLVRVPDS